MTWMVLGLGVGLIIFAYMNGRTAGRDRVIAVQAGQTAERMKQNAKSGCTSKALTPCDLTRVYLTEQERAVLSDTALQQIVENNLIIKENCK